MFNSKDTCSLPHGSGAEHAGCVGVDLQGDLVTGRLLTLHQHLGLVNTINVH